jgi:hypothetical protein
VLPSALHEEAYRAPTETQVTAQIAAPVVGTLEVQAATLDEPLDLEADASVDEVVKVAVGVFERQGVRVDEVVGDEQVEFGGEGGEGGGAGVGFAVWRGWY